MRCLNLLVLKKGARCYLAVHGGWQAQSGWGSHSTNLRVNAEGHNGAALKNMISFFLAKTTGSNTKQCSPGCNGHYNRYGDVYRQHVGVRIIKAMRMSNWANSPGIAFPHRRFSTAQSDRMGYRLQGEALKKPTIKTCYRLQLRGNHTVCCQPANWLCWWPITRTGGYPIVARDQRRSTNTGPEVYQWKNLFQACYAKSRELALLQQQYQLDQLQLMTGNTKPLSS